MMILNLISPSYKTYIANLILIISFFKSNAQENIVISGTVKNTKQNVLPYSNIKIYKDSIVFKNIICDSLANFNFSLPAGKYQLRASSIEFVEYRKDLSFNKSENITIVLTDKTNQLSEINIIKKRPLIEHKIDRIVFNVENGLFDNGENMIDLLRVTPRIQVAGDEAISMIGKTGNLKIMINGRILNLSPEDIKIRLKSLRSENISKIEVIAIPPSKYSAEGNAGMINIILKRDPFLGFQGSANLEYIQRIKPSFNESANATYKSKKIEILSSISNDNSKIKNITNGLIKFSNDDQINNENSLDASSNTLSISNTIRYTPTKSIEIGASYDFSNTTIHNSEFGYNIYGKQLDNKIDSTVNSTSTHFQKPISKSLSTYFDYSIDTLGKKISFTYNYSTNASTTNRQVNSHILSSNSINQQQIYLGDNNYRINSAFIDLELPYHFIKVETGLGYTSINNTTMLQVYDNIDDLMQQNNNQTNSFNYSEKTTAIYVSANKDFNNNWSTKIGLRYEYTSLVGISPTLSQTNKSNYGKFFPTFYLLYNLNSKNTFSLGYSKRVDRPSFNTLNPFKIYSNSYTYYSGNSYLLPSFSHNLELNYTYNNNLSIILSASRYLDGIDYVALYNNGISSLIPENNFNQNRIGLDISYTIMPFTWWSIYNSGNLNYNRTKNYNPILPIPNTSGYGASVLTESTFTLNKEKTFFLGLSYYNNFPSKSGFQYFKNLAYLSANLKFITMNKRLTFMISSFDVFKQNITIAERSYSTYQTVWKTDAKVQNFRFAINYSFGNNKVQGKYRNMKNEAKYRAQ